MAFQYSVSSRNAQLDAIETTTGTEPTLEIRTGAPPATCATADSGSVLVSMTLPSDWMADASGGVKAIAGSWTASATGTGTAGHFRIKQGATCHIQGTVSQREADGGTGDMKLAQANSNINEGSIVTVTAFSITAGGE
jgi:hypothetical protein